MTTEKMLVVASPGLDGEILAVHRGGYDEDNEIHHRGYDDEMIAEYKAREFDVIEVDDADIDWATTRVRDGELVTVEV